MLSTSNDPRGGDAAAVEDRILDAAHTCVVDFGVDRVTLSEIARRAGVSRPTVYRRWPDARSVVAALLTRTIAGVVDGVPAMGDDREALVARVVTVAGRLRRDPLIGAVLRSGPELAMVYIAERLGTSQQIVVDALAAAIERGQHTGTVRAGDPVQLAVMILLVTQSTVQSAQLVAPVLDDTTLATELTRLLDGYLRTGVTP
ncbi:TetR/AcrR family transcriptional regulator [Rhodococcus sp. HNM0569]|uniref:TetR/AcrR family transcriptional regulator n=1 Tax=Rhodococcus sp. HNM0569 TaxID=2716340 RepID=UPI00146E8219|nr:TetR/AcrR family transcriptional regulator [Rhodococcus sp. HNM0569]NLU83337.1 TetR/AcrR family transcriptional regulator [Rhodococcus sp. HNM0569]